MPIVRHDRRRIDVRKSGVVHDPRDDRLEQHVSYVVVIRAWFEGDQFRARAIMGPVGSTRNRVVETSSSIERLCESLATYFRQAKLSSIRNIEPKSQPHCGPSGAPS